MALVLYSCAMRPPMVSLGVFGGTSYSINLSMGWAFTTNKVRIMSDGTPWRPVVHVEDIAAAFAAALVAPSDTIHNQAFNVGIDEENYRVRELASVVHEVVPGCSIEYADKSGPDPRSYRVNFGKLASKLPCAALRWNVREGARQLYNAFRCYGLLAGDLHGRRFNRLAQLRYLLDTGVLANSLRWYSNGAPRPLASCYKKSQPKLHVTQ